MTQPLETSPQIAALIKAGNIINAKLDIREVLCAIMEEVKGVMQTEAGTLYLLDEKTNELVIEIAQGPVGRKLTGLRFKIPEGICGWVANTGEAVVIPDATKDPRFNPKPDQDTNFATRSVLCVPMKYQEHTVGVMQVINKTGPGTFTDMDVEVFKLFATYAAVAIKNAANSVRFPMKTAC